MIHPTAIIDPKAILAGDVSIGAYSIIDAHVEIDSGTVVDAHVVIKGPTRIGKNNRIHQFSSLGEAPQDKKYKGEPTSLTIGDNNLIREYVSINRGTVQDQGTTTIGDANWIMAYVHIAHDCVLGNNIIFSNAASLAGHVVVGNNAILSGFVLVSQFCHIGAFSFAAMGSAINRDVPPYVLVAGNMAKPYGINAEGLKRHDFGSDSIATIKKAYRLIYKSGKKLEDALVEVDEMAISEPTLKPMADFIRGSKRGIIR